MIRHQNVSRGGEGDKGGGHRWRLDALLELFDVYPLLRAQSPLTDGWEHPAWVGSVSRGGNGTSADIYGRYK